MTVRYRHGGPIMVPTQRQMEMAVLSPSLYGRLRAEPSGISASFPRLSGRTPSQSLLMLFMTACMSMPRIPIRCLLVKSKLYSMISGHLFLTKLSLSPSSILTVCTCSALCQIQMVGRVKPFVVRAILMTMAVQELTHTGVTR